MRADPEPKSNDHDAMAVCLAVVRGRISMEQARHALQERSPATSACTLLGLGASLQKEAETPARLGGEEISACLNLIERLQPERSGRELLRQEESLARMLVEAGRLSQEEVDEYLAVQNGLVESGERPLPGLSDLLKTGPSPGAPGDPRQLQIPGFELRELLGKGAMGSVYKARQTALDRWVAVKVMKTELAQDPRFIEQFQAEARTAGKLRHQNIVSALDCGHSQGQYYLIMEHVEGRSLFQVLQEKGKLPEGQALGIALQAARGLENAWEHRIIHRDIKPENILITPEGVAKICDLGLCREIRSAVTAAGMEGIACTPSYASPEQAQRKRDLDCRTDVYSLGIVLYQMVTGSLPFHGKPQELLAKQLTELPSSPRSRNPEISPGVDRLILDMIEKVPGKRPQNPGEVVRRIESLLSPALRPRTARSSATHGLRGSPTTRRSLPTGSRAASRGKTGLWFAAAAGLVVAGAFAVSLQTRARETPPSEIAAPVHPKSSAPATLPEVSAPPRPSVGALKGIEDLVSASRPPGEILFACDEIRKTIQGSPEETRFKELEQRALQAAKEERLKNFLDQVRKRIDQDPSFERSAEILRMLRSSGSSSAELEVLNADYERRLEQAARLARDEILERALPLRALKRWNDALALIRGFPVGLAASKYGPELENLAREIDREWSAQIALEQGRSKWTGWRISWGAAGELPLVHPSWDGRALVLATPPSQGLSPFVLEREWSIPEEGGAYLSAWVAAEEGQSWELDVRVKREALARVLVGKERRGWQEVHVDLSRFQGTSVQLRLEAKAPGGGARACYWSEIELRTMK